MTARQAFATNQTGTQLVATINGTEGNDTLTGGPDADTINGFGGDDTIFGGGGDDRIDTGTGIDIVEAGGGDDIVISQSSSGNVNGGDGYDRLVYTLPGTSAGIFSVSAHQGQLSGTVTSAGEFFGFDEVESVLLVGSQSGDQFSIGVDYFAAGSTIDLDGAGGSDILFADFSLFTGPTTFVMGQDGTVTSNRGASMCWMVGTAMTGSAEALVPIAFGGGQAPIRSSTPRPI